MYVCLKETTCVWVWLGKRHDLWKKAGHVNERNFELDFFLPKVLWHDSRSWFEQRKAFSKEGRKCQDGFGLKMANRCPPFWMLQHLFSSSNTPCAALQSFPLLRKYNDHYSWLIQNLRNASQCLADLTPIGGLIGPGATFANNDAP